MNTLKRTGESYNFIRVVTFPVPPNSTHSGWVRIDFDDIFNIFTENEMIYFENEFINESMLIELDVNLKGFSLNGGIYDYSESLFGIDYIIALSDSQVFEIKRSAKTYKAYLDYLPSPKVN